MIEKINSLLHEVESFAPTTAAQVEEFRIKILGKKGELNALMEEFKQVPAEQKREMGQKINALKQAAQERINSLKASLGSRRHTPPNFNRKEPDCRYLLSPGLHRSRGPRD